MSNPLAGAGQAAGNAASSALHAAPGAIKKTASIAVRLAKWGSIGFVSVFALAAAAPAVAGTAAVAGVGAAAGTTGTAATAAAAGAAGTGTTSSLGAVATAIKGTFINNLPAATTTLTTALQGTAGFIGAKSAALSSWLVPTP